MSDVARKPSRRKSTPLKVSSKSGQGDAGENNPTDTHSVSGGSKEKERENQRERSESNGKIEPAASHAVDGLVAAIGEHDRFFSTMLDMIPENLVLPAKEVPEAAYASKYMKNKKEEAPQQARKEESKSKKRARYAPENQKTVNERQQERAQAEKEEDEAEDSIALELDEGNAAKADDEEGEERGDGGEQDKALIPEVLRKKTMNVGSMDALRKRIAERIKESQEKRQAAEGSRRAKAAERKNKEKETKREKKKNASKMKKSKPKETKKTGLGTTGQDSKESASDGAAAEGASEKSHEKAASKDKLAAADVQSPVAGSEPELPPLPAVEDIGDMEFSGMRGMALSSKKGPNLPPKVGAPGSKTRRLHGLLASAKEKKKRLEGLRQSEEGKKKALEETWDDAMRVAGGENVKDNPAALKKMIKRREKDKAKSASQWKDRSAGVKKEQAVKQTKREENLKKRKSKGVASASTPGDNAEREQKKRQRRAGFEGKRQDFINKEKPGSSTQGGGKKTDRAAGRG